MSNQSTVIDMINTLAAGNPALATALELLTQDVYKAYYAQFPPTAASVFGVTGQVAVVTNVLNFQSLILSNDLRLTWDSISGINEYEIRYIAGSVANWDTAVQILRTSTLSADLNPVQIPLVYGNHTFLIKAIDSNGIYSTAAASLTINVPQITAPTVTPTVIDNNVLLKWTIPASIFQLSHYNVYRDGTFIGNMNGTFEAIFETTAGSFTYAVEAVDIVGNVGTQGTVTAAVNQPPDYELQDERVSDFSGTKVNVVETEDGTALLCCVSTTHTWSQHFTTASKTSIQDFIDAGYSYWLEPSETSGSYEEIVDYGTVITNVILSVRYSIFTLDPSVTVQFSLSFSEDGITYTTPETTDSAFSPSMRYAKIHATFTGTDDKALILFSNLIELLDVKREVDSGSVSALASDASGTAVLFNKTFKDVDSITLTVGATEPVTAIYDFADIPNPTGFSVYIFDNSGNRASYSVSWKARGIV